MNFLPNGAWNPYGPPVVAPPPYVQPLDECCLCLHHPDFGDRLGAVEWFQEEINNGINGTALGIAQLGERFQNLVNTRLAPAPSPELARALEEIGHLRGEVQSLRAENADLQSTVTAAKRVFQLKENRRDEQFTRLTHRVYLLEGKLEQQNTRANTEKARRNGEFSEVNQRVETVEQMIQSNGEKIAAQIEHLTKQVDLFGGTFKTENAQLQRDIKHLEKVWKNGRTIEPVTVKQTIPAKDQKPTPNDDDLLGQFAAEHVNGHAKPNPAVITSEFLIVELYYMKNPKSNFFLTEYDSATRQPTRKKAAVIRDDMHSNVDRDQDFSYLSRLKQEGKYLVLTNKKTNEAYSLEDIE